MSRCFNRLSLLIVLLLTGEAWAVGLGDIKLDSALNEPLRAEIVLLSAGPDELSDLTVALASAETFARYGIDRPFYLQEVEFNVVGRDNGSVVQIRSRSPVTEPFLTFLVEANWASGRLLREYTVLLDPPTYVAPAAQQAQPVQAPRRSTANDSGRIERQATTPSPAQQPSRPAAQPSQPARSGSDTTGYRSPPDSAPTAVVDDSPYDTASGDNIIVRKGQTLWGLAASSRPDSRLTMNQTMMAIYQANPSAFGGNINSLKAGASLRIPSADEVFQISRGEAQSEVQRQHSAWGGIADYSTSSGSTSPEPQATVPSLTLVPPDDEPASTDYEDTPSTYEPLNREDEIQNRINQLEAMDVPRQQSLIEIRDNELAALRQELADIRGDVYEPELDDETDNVFVDEDLASDETGDEAGDEAAQDETGIDDVMSDDTATDDAVVADVDDAADDSVPTNIVTTPARDDESIVDKILGFLTGTWGIISAAVLLVAFALIWFVRRGGDDEEVSDRPWEALDSDEMAAGTFSGTAAIPAPVPDDDAIVVVEQDSGVNPILDDIADASTAEVPAADTSESFGSLEDTFSSETAVNLDQTDPIAEADFHMAYGLYDQAADLINGALESDPADKSLMSKLCEIYFVWGNRGAFVDAATRFKAAVGSSDSAEWDKIVIMGQQIASDDALFAGAELAGAGSAVDMSFEDSDDGATGALDMDFGADGGDSSDIIDLGKDEETHEGVDFDFDAPNDQSAVDFDLETTAETPTIESTMTEATAEMPMSATDSSAADDPFGVTGDGTSELPSLDEASLTQAIEDSGKDADATAEINLDDLDFDVDGLAETELASLDDLDATGQNETLSDTGINEALGDLDFTGVTGKNPAIDPNSTGVLEGIDLGDLEDSGVRLAADETGQNPSVTAEREHDVSDLDIDDSLLDATGLTQVLSGDMAVDTAADLGGELSDAEAQALKLGSNDDTIENLADEAETLLAPLDDDDDFDFAKTEALPPEAFTTGTELDTTAETAAIAGTDVDLDLDDLTAALQVSEIGDTVEQPRDDATVEQPRPTLSEDTSEVPTMALAPEDIAGELHEARTMTEVGTKLDLARAYVDMGDPVGARSILEEVLDEGDEGQKQQAQQLLDSLPS